MLDKAEKLGLITTIIIGFLTLFMDYRLYDPMTRSDEFLPVLWIMFIGLYVMIAIILFTDYYIYSTYKILSDEDKYVLIDLVIAFFITPFSLFFASIRTINLILFGTTAKYFEFFGKRYIDPIAMALFILTVVFSAYFYTLWALKMSNKYSIKTGLIFLTIYIIVALLAIHPDNNYSNQIEYVTPIKILSRLSLSLVFSLAALLIIFEVHRRIKNTDDVEKMVRLIILELSNIIMIISLIFWFLDGLTETTYSIYVLISESLYVFAFMGVSISIIWPEWFSKIISILIKKYALAHY